MPFLRATARGCARHGLGVAGLRPLATFPAQAQCQPALATASTWIPTLPLEVKTPPSRRRQFCSSAPAAQQPAESGSETSTSTSSPLPSINRMIQQSRAFQPLQSLLGRDRALEAAPRPHHLHVFTHKHNTHITLTRPNATVMLSLSCGNIGLRKAQRKTYDAAHQLTAHVLAQINEKYLNPAVGEGGGLAAGSGPNDRIRQVEVVFKGYGVGREAFTKALLGAEGKHIRPLVCKVTDATKLKFGGPRSRASRRLG